MTKAEAREYALRVLAAEARHHAGNGSEWMERPLDRDGLRVQEDGAFSDADRERIAEAVENIAAQMERASRRLAYSRRLRSLRSKAASLKKEVAQATSRRPSR